MPVSAEDLGPRLPTPLLAWFASNARELPWRRAPHRGDPYAVLVAEAMAQQTRVATAAPYFERWMARWPTVEDLARATEEEVLGAWQGLGYYARARRLLAAARIIASEGWPRTAEGLAALPGVGPYTAAAVASMAFGEAVPCVDGNVARVHARLTGAAVDIADPRVRHRTARALEPWVAERPGEVNEALMELGATVCTPAAPACGACPLDRWCLALAEGRVDEVPRPSARRPVPEVPVEVALVERDGGVLLERRAEGGLLAGLWGPPMVERAPEEPPEVALARRLGASIEVGPVVAELTHTFTHKRYRAVVRTVRREEGGGPRAGRYVAWEGEPGVPLSTLDRKVLAAVRAARAPGARAPGAGAPRTGRAR